jgi:hypothetical protein
MSVHQKSGIHSDDAFTPGNGHQSLFSILIMNCLTLHSLFYVHRVTGHRPYLLIPLITSPLCLLRMRIRLLRCALCGRCRRHLESERDEKHGGNWYKQCSHCRSSAREYQRRMAATKDSPLDPTIPARDQGRFPLSGGL